MMVRMLPKRPVLSETSACSAWVESGKGAPAMVIGAASLQ